MSQVWLRVRYHKDEFRRVLDWTFQICPEFHHVTEVRISFLSSLQTCRLFDLQVWHRRDPCHVNQRQSCNSDDPSPRQLLFIQTGQAALCAIFDSELAILQHLSPVWRFTCTTSNTLQTILQLTCSAFRGFSSCRTSCLHSVSRRWNSFKPPSCLCNV